jgi:hypothetical protein
LEQDQQILDARFTPVAEEDRTYITPEIEKRQYRRVRLVTEVRCEPLSRDELLLTRDISVGGLFLNCKDPLPKGSEVALSFHLRPGGPVVNCHGKVAHSLAGVGMGIQFLDLSEEPRQAIQKLVDEFA